MEQFNNNSNNDLKPKRPRLKVFFISLIVITLGGLLYYGFFYLYCSLPVHYSVGDIDPRFNIKREEVITIAQEAEGRWNSAIGQEILKYDPEASLKITFVYDQRQADLDKLNTELQKIGASNSNLESSAEQIEKLNDQYEKDLEDYSARLKIYNDKVTYYNNQGGAPADIYTKLQTESENFDQEKSALDQRRSELIRLSTLYDSQVGEYNNDLEKINNHIKEKQNQLVTQGLYYSAENKIDIFTFGNKEELRLLLMHELAHATGIDHSENDKAVMSPILNPDLEADPLPTADDLNLIKSRCQINFLICKLSN